MAALLYGAGLIIGITIFLYLYSSFQTGKEKLNQMKKPQKTEPITDEVENPHPSFRNNIPPGARLCPICGNALTKYEALYASHTDTTAGKKLLIHGCRYCYKPEEEEREISQQAM
jgi:hypothetical protein